MTECYQGSITCYREHEQCQYQLSIRITGTLMFGRNGAHLSSCSDVKRGKRVRCPDSYCIPYKNICDGRWDCWDGDDEYECENRTCSGLFQCRNVSTCIHIDDVCDKDIDYQHKDDELLCDLEACVPKCSCPSYAVSCQEAVLLPHYHSSYDKYVYINIFSSKLLFDRVYN